MQLATAQLADGPWLHYAASGAQGSDPLLFLHGWPDSWFSFSRLLPLLPQSCRAIAPDQRGFGESRRPAASFAVTDFAADAAALLDALQIERVTVVGHSFGSFVARRFALSHPDRVRHLVLIGSGLRPANDVTREVLASLRDLPDPIPLEFVRQFQASTAYAPLPDAFFERIVVESQKAPARVWRETFTHLLSYDDAADLRKIAAPTHLMWGDHDALFNRADQDALLTAIPGATLRVYREIGHCPNWECPEEVARDLVAFIQSR